MGLLYSKFYIDFDESDWKQTSNEPLVFQTLKDGVTLEIEDVSHKSFKLHFKKGGRLYMLRVTGKYRLTWDENDVV